MKAHATSLRLHRRSTRAAVLVLALVVAGCGADSPNPQSAQPTTSAGARTTPPATAARVAAKTTTETTMTETSTPAAQAPCGAEVFLPVLEKEFDNEATSLRIVGAEVKRCRNDHAVVFAVPDESVCQPGIGSCFEREQVFLGWTGDSWQILTYGTGITCEVPGFETGEIGAICRALGYPGY